MRALALSVLIVATTLASAQQNPYLGRWNMTGTGDDANQVFWLEIKQDGEQLTGLFLNRTGNPGPLGIVKIDSGELVFQAGRPDRPSGPEFRAKIENGRLIGHHTITQGGGRNRAAAGRGGADPPAPPAPTQRVINWIGVRPPAWPNVNANANHNYGTPVVLFDGKSLDAFTVQTPSRPLNWAIADGLAANTPPANNLVSKEKFKDFKIEAEYKLGPKSNGGIYLRGRYELQLLEDINDTTTRPDLSHMAIYGRTAPSVKASKAADEWQTMMAVVVGNRVTVTLNGTRVHDNAVIEGITGGALDNDELAPGPILIQGDHSHVWLRRLVVTPIK